MRRVETILTVLALLLCIALSGCFIVDTVKEAADSPAGATIATGAKAVAAWLPAPWNQICLLGGGLITWIRGRRYKAMLNSVVDGVAKSFEGLDPAVVEAMKETLGKVAAKHNLGVALSKHVKKQVG